MSHSSDASNERANLHQRAVAQLTSGSQAPPKRASTTQALTVLHQLASSPSTADDAIALLHELQVHQVELDLQQEELLRSRAELEAALIRQTAVVERAPVGCMTVDASTVLCEINLAGARLLGAAPGALLGRPLAGFLAAPSAGTLQALLARAREGLAPETFELRLLPVAGVAQTVYATADKDTAPDSFLLALMAGPSPVAGVVA